ncbi:Os03g0126850 [Oryza sativa Japonica Group]|uniref:Os03g0126850 protein n=2 Tax=Oryza sativa subsp. japonica TaxID=39947 RepID=C7J0K1_ORYSJ|nr:hypothetical protein EE612_015051 [Oryza sativa]BAH91975.1 Os03g0126850 [Oryza sativa Japonica Group]BAS82087.1 Os03g0126850 [Oryza sativa Japonica Group]|eukprot:NP_001173247.1 Os03g0126850 [Oryza sativa Japonica Group]
MYTRRTDDRSKTTQSSLGSEGRRDLVLDGAEAAEAAARTGGEEGEPGDERGAEEDEADGHHPQLLMRRVERHRPPHQHGRARHPRRRHARRHGEARPRQPHSLPRRRRSSLPSSSSSRLHVHRLADWLPLVLRHCELAGGRLVARCCCRCRAAR